MKICLVMGTTGEYSDRTEWVVAAFISRAMAHQYAEKANQWCIENNVSMNGTKPKDLNRNFDHHAVNPYDKVFSYSYTGTDYFVVENINVLDALDGVDSD
jgi:hypothetical protein